MSPRAPIGQQKGEHIMRQAALSLAFIALALPFLAAAPAQALDARTWVSGTGDDANPCSRTAPCRTFNAAIAAAVAGGEVNCLDAGDFGTGAIMGGFGDVTIHVVISKSITISCEAGTAGILVSSRGIGVFIDGATTDVVTLRGLDIDGQGLGDVGIYVDRVKAVHVEKCTIRNFRFDAFAAGLFTPFFFPVTVFLFVADTVISDISRGVSLNSAGGFKVASLKNVTIAGSTGDGLQLIDSNIYANVTKSIISGNGNSAVYVGASNATVNIDRSTIANNAYGLFAASSGSIIRASGNNIFNNTTGFFIGGGAQIQSDGTNNTGGSNGGATVPNAALAKN